uniref:Small ribosomal subunit protein bS18c n=1 Tax=Kirchneriella aperta TaxID=117505 RepID=A0A140H9Z5_9CHLO|nr:ribosomal protein S18 [Kirchneriella aperta]AMO00994.1 ribosomal protein S18 [Kirchneriella aperta]
MNENTTSTHTNLLKEKPSTNLLKISGTTRNQNSVQKKKTEIFTKKYSPKGTGSRNDGKQSVSSSTLRRRKVLSISQLLLRVQKQKQRQFNQKKRQKPVKPIIPPKSLIIILKDKPEKAVYNRRIIDYKHCGLLQRYIGLGGKILPRRQTKLTAKQQRYVAKTIKSARIMGLLPFVTKERGFFR